MVETANKQIKHTVEDINKPIDKTVLGIWTCGIIHARRIFHH